MKVQKTKIIFGIIIIFIIIFFIIERFVNIDKYEVEEEQNIEIEDVSKEEPDTEASIADESGKQEDLNRGEDEEEIETEEIVEKKIYVYVTGEVNNRGVVILNEGSRITDAIEAAGGLTEKADISKINLVYALRDGMKVTIPNSDDLKEDTGFNFVTVGSGDNSIENTTSTDVEEDNDSNSVKNNMGIININTASQTELESLPGIGPSIALKIINFRNENGKFSSIEDIKNVSGIGESKFKEIKDFICI